MKTKHTPTPWKTLGSDQIMDGNGETICLALSYIEDKKLPQLENAAHIVKCVNLHDGFIELVKSLLSDKLDIYRLTDDEIVLARSLLKRARGEA